MVLSVISRALTVVNLMEKRMETWFKSIKKSRQIDLALLKMKKR